MHRLFVAFRPPALIRNQLIGLMGGVAGARWQDDAQLHLTLRYIGPVERQIAEDVAIALSAVRAQPFEIALSGMGCFEHKGRIEAIWAGVSPRDPLAALHRKVDQALVRAGLETEHRAYSPHITLARFGRVHDGLEGFLADNAALTSQPFSVDGFALYESHLGKGGAHYEAIAEYPLGRAG